MLLKHSTLLLAIFLFVSGTSLRVPAGKAPGAQRRHPAAVRGTSSGIVVGELKVAGGNGVEGNDDDSPRSEAPDSVADEDEFDGGDALGCDASGNCRLARGGSECSAKCGCIWREEINACIDSTPSSEDDFEGSTDENGKANEADGSDATEYSTSTDDDDDGAAEDDNRRVGPNEATPNEPGLALPWNRQAAKARNCVHEGHPCHTAIHEPTCVERCGCYWGVERGGDPMGCHDCVKGYPCDSAMIQPVCIQRCGCKWDGQACAVIEWMFEKDTEPCKEGLDCQSAHLPDACDELCYCTWEEDADACIDERSR